MLFRDGILLFAQPGVVAAQALDDLIAQARRIDMDEVRREIAKRLASERSGG
jgi:thioredoxin 1